MKKFKNFGFSILIGMLLTVFFWACTKEVPKELLNTNKQQMPSNKQEMPNDSIHKNLMQNNNQEQTNEPSYSDDSATVAKLTKDADDADAKYQKTKSDADKKDAVDKQMAAANFLMFKADSFTPKKKYRPALKRYSRVIEIDPSNKEAAANKKQIEDIYTSMGMPIPTD
jgi:FtsZ-interacting cell division protein ZipA